jgi:hypothetical protein
MEKITVLLPEAEVGRHIIDICDDSIKFDVGRGLAPFDKINVLPGGPPRKIIFLRQAQENGKPIGYVHILPVRDNSIVKFVAESPNADFDEFAKLVTEYFQDLNLLAEIPAKPVEAQLAEPATVDEEIGQRSFPKKRSVEFDCSQDKLFEFLTINLSLEEKWPQGYSIRSWDKSMLDLGQIQLLIDKKRLLNQKGDYDTEYIGRLTIGKMGDDVSILFVRSDNQDLLMCFDELVKVVSGYKKIHTNLEQADLAAESNKSQSRRTLPGLIGDDKDFEKVRLNHTAGLLQPGHIAKNPIEAEAIKASNASAEMLKKLNLAEGVSMQAEKPQEMTSDNYDDAIIRFGTDKNLSLSDVKGIVKRCNAFVKSGGKVTEFYSQHSQDKYELETLRKWLKDSRFTN